MTRGVGRCAVFAALLSLLLCAAPAVAQDATPAARNPVPAKAAPSFGADLDWATDNAGDYVSRLGFAPGVFGTSVPYPVVDADRAALDTSIAQIGAYGATALITVRIAVPLADLDAEMANDFAALMARYNGQGVPVIVRFAPEMNGSWQLWGQQPTGYVAAFRAVAAAVHRDAPDTAMLWSPNYGGGYPFQSNPQAISSNPELSVLDTDGDGTLTMADDPYTPYYPGDDAVDWVGMSLFYWGNAYPWGENEVPEADKLRNELTGRYVGANGDERALPNFYDLFARGRNKPLALQTGAMFNPEGSGAGELEIKRGWWRQMFGLDGERPLRRLKLVSWFERRQAEPEAGGIVVDWTLTFNPAVRDALKADLALAGQAIGASPPPQASPIADPIGEHAVARTAGWRRSWIAT